MKVKRDDTKEARRYWQFLDENSKIVATWPEWKRGARGATPASPIETETIPKNSEENKE